MEIQSWGNSYYMKNEDVLGLLRTWRAAPLNTTEKNNVENLLIKRLLYLVQSRVRGYKEQSYYEDLFQEGILGLYQAFRKYDPERGPNFFIVAKWYINSCVRNFLNKQNGGIKEVPTENCGASLSSDETLEQQFEKLQDYQMLRKAIANLPEADQSVINMRFGMSGEEPKTMQQIGDAFCVSRQRIDQIQRRALVRLKRELDKYTKE